MSTVFTRPERVIPSKERLVPLYYAGVDREEVKICLKRRPPPSKQTSKPMGMDGVLWSFCSVYNIIPLQAIQRASDVV